MKKINKRIAGVMLAAAMLGTAFAGCGKDEKLDGTQIVATVDDYKVTLGMAHFILRENQASSEDYMDYLAEVYGMDASSFAMWDDMTETEDGTRITYGQKQKEEVMGSICELYAFKNHAKDYNIELTEEDNTKIAAAAKQFMEDNTQEAIDALGVSESDIVTYLELVTIRGKMHDPMLKDVDREVSNEEANQTTVTYVTITKNGTERDDEGYLIKLEGEALEAKKKLGEDIIAAIQKEDDIAKADIEKIAKGIDETATVTTSSYTTSNTEQYAVNKVITEAVKKMKDGEVLSTVLESDDSFFVVRLDAMLDKEATQEKKETIIQNREQEAFDKLAEKWTYETKVTIDHDVWGQVELTDRQSFRYVEKDDEKKEESDKKDDSAK